MIFTLKKKKQQRQLFDINDVFLLVSFGGINSAFSTHGGETPFFLNYLRQLKLNSSLIAWLKNDEWNDNDFRRKATPTSYTVKVD